MIDGVYQTPNRKVGFSSSPVDLCVSCFSLHLQVKNAGRKLGRRCDMCSNYEKQLQAIQGQEAETRDQVCFCQTATRRQTADVVGQ